MDRRVTKTKDNIRRAFLDLLLENSYNEITVKELTEKANIGRKTFYLHYSCIDDVIKELEFILTSIIDKRIDKYIKDNTNYKIEHIFSDINRLINKNVIYCQKIAKSDSYAFLEKSCESILKNAITKIFKELYQVKSPNTSIYASFYASGIITLYLEWLRGEISISMDDLTRIASRCSFLSLEDIMNEKN